MANADLTKSLSRVVVYAWKHGQLVELNNTTTLTHFCVQHLTSWPPPRPETYCGNRETSTSTNRNMRKLWRRPRSRAVSRTVLQHIPTMTLQPGDVWPAQEPICCGIYKLTSVLDAAVTIGTMQPLGNASSCDSMILFKYFNYTHSLSINSNFSSFCFFWCPLWVSFQRLRLFLCGLIIVSHFFGHKVFVPIDTLLGQIVTEHDPPEAVEPNFRPIFFQDTNISICTLREHKIGKSMFIRCPYKNVQMRGNF